MRLIERLQEYLQANHISAYSFEHTCRLSNGYLGKQLKGKGAVGSDILEKIKENYTDLSLIWLVTGRGTMTLLPPEKSKGLVDFELNEEQQLYFTSKDDVIQLLHKQVAKLELTICDKNSIIDLLEEQLRNRSLLKKYQ